MRVGSRHTKLIILRGNSGSGKGATAAGLRARYGRGLAIIGQDAIRRDMLKERDQPDALNISLIDMLARRLLDEGMHVVIEGILTASRYASMLTALERDHEGQTHRYYFDLPFDVTVQRHWTKPNCHDFTTEDMRSWFVPGDVLPGGTDRIIGPDNSLTETVEQILAQTGLLLAPPPPHPSLAPALPAESNLAPPLEPRHTARVVIVDGDLLVLFKRVQPSRDPQPYWVTVGGGIEPQDVSPEAAMRREVAEEIGGTVGAAQQVFVHTEDKPGGIRFSYVFLAALVSMDLSARSGEEFGLDDRGTYEVQRIPFTAAGIGSIRLLPAELAEYLAANADGLRELATVGAHAFGTPPAKPGAVPEMLLPDTETAST